MVADAEPDAPFALAHAPALDVGGLCAPNSTVLMKKRPPGGKTSHSIELVISAGPNGNADEDVLVGAHPQLGEKLAEEVLRRGLLSGEIGFEAATETLPSSPKKKKKATAKSSPKKGKADDGDDVEKLAPGTYLKKQVTYGDSRVDFELTVVEERRGEGARGVLGRDEQESRMAAVRGRDTLGPKRGADLLSIRGTFPLHDRQFNLRLTSHLTRHVFLQAGMLHQLRNVYGEKAHRTRHTRTPHHTRPHVHLSLALVRARLLCTAPALRCTHSSSSRHAAPSHLRLPKP